MVKSETLLYLIAPTRVEANAVHERMNRRVKELKSTILKKNTVEPKSSVKGLVAVETPPLKADKIYYTVPVNFAGDTHKFRIERTVKE